MKLIFLRTPKKKKKKKYSLIRNNTIIKFISLIFSNTIKVLNYIIKKMQIDHLARFSLVAICKLFK